MLGTPINVHRRAFGTDLRGHAELQGPLRQVDVVAGHVTDGPFAEGPPPPPGFGEIVRAVRAFGNGAEPLVPVDVRGRGHAEARGLVLEPVLGDVDVNLVDGADGAALN